MTLIEAVSIRLRELLKENNCSLTKFEKISGMSHSTLMCILSNRYLSVNLKTICDICDTFHITLNEFFNSDLFNLDELLI